MWSHWRRSRNNRKINISKFTSIPDIYLMNLLSLGTTGFDTHDIVLWRCGCARFTLSLCTSAYSRKLFSCKLSFSWQYWQKTVRLLQVCQHCASFAYVMSSKNLRSSCGPILESMMRDMVTKTAAEVPTGPPDWAWTKARKHYSCSMHSSRMARCCNLVGKRRPWWSPWGVRTPCQ